MKKHKEWHWFEILIIAAALLSVLATLMLFCQHGCSGGEFEVSGLTMEDRAAVPFEVTDYYAPKD